MSGCASVKETLNLWACLLRSTKDWIVPLFTQKRVADSACVFPDVLIGNEPRKTDGCGQRSQEIRVHGGSRHF
ncbi:hypothetical protein ACI01nite_19220 [Acetobacter cibinongensis]|uniref:Transposase n=1 Tax=Acetobacter cibinongensis TaxID=146475 RepID=A0A0D6N1C7_9PROT|nr:transposase [Acetobacter cibinongensis]GEL59320.1 hypothetical protein ACI01nite_19220 [Acetobacter cibinongensis]